MIRNAGPGGPDSEWWVEGEGILGNARWVQTALGDVARAMPSDDNSSVLTNLSRESIHHAVLFRVHKLDDAACARFSAAVQVKCCLVSPPLSPTGGERRSEGVPTRHGAAQRLAFAYKGEEQSADQ